ncbi:MAG: dehydrogenase [Fibrobacteres bacterium]|nr:dehydrogenase [Fibrobacterota bacterium]
MKYLCLVYLEERMRDALPKAELDAWIRDALSYHETLRKSGHFLAAQALQSVHAATTLRARGGKVSLTDGPFAETKEQLAGFILIEARDLNEAIHAASRIPGARYGSVEVRPIWELNDLYSNERD